MGKRLLDFDPLTGTATYHEYDEMEDTTLITTVQDYDDILNANKQATNAYDKHIARKSEFRRVASIPTGVMHKWMVEEGIDVFNKDHWPAVRRKLNSSDHSFLRTNPTVI